MSATWLTLITILSVSCTALDSQESGGPVWKSKGGSITIHCSTSLPDQHSVSLQWRLHEEDQLFTMQSSGNNTTKSAFKHRLKAKGKFPKLDFTITDLTVEDSGAYWCIYKSLDKNYRLQEEEGSGSLLLVVKGEVDKCEDKTVFLVLLCSLTAFILCLIVFFIWIIPKVKAWRASKRPSRPRTNDVYEDMRATLRR